MLSFWHTLAHEILLYPNIQAKESSALDTVQLTESEKSDVKDEMNELSWSIERDSGSAESSYQPENTKVSHVLEGGWTAKEPYLLQNELYMINSISTWTWTIC